MPQTGNTPPVEAGVKIYMNRCYLQNGYTFRGSNSDIFICCSPSVELNSLRKEVAPVGANSLRVGSFFERISLLQDAIRM